MISERVQKRKPFARFRTFLCPLSFLQPRRVATFHERRISINLPLTVSDCYQYLILNRFWRNNDSPPPPYCPPQYIQTIPLSHMVVSSKVTTQPLPGPSGGVPKMAITVFTKTPAEHLEERRWPTVYGPGIFSPEYWRRAVKRWRDGEKSLEWALPDPPSG